MAREAKSELFVQQQPGGMFAVEDQSISTGNRFFVDSGNTTNGANAAGKGRNPDYPFLTIDYAIGQCTADNGDIIRVMPGHAETLSAAAAITIDVDAIKIVGGGWGDSRPTLSIDTEHTEEAPISITASGVVFENFRLVGINAGGSKNAIAVTGPANDITFKDLDFIETSTDKELGIGAAYGVITLLDAAGVIARVNFINCNMIGLAGHDESFVSVTDGTSGATDLLFQNCRIVGTFADDILQFDAGTNVNTRITILDSMLVNMGGNNIVVTFDTGGVAFMHNLAVFGAGSTTAPIVQYNASYLGNVFTCEPGAYGATTLIGSVTNWGA